MRRFLFAVPVILVILGLLLVGCGTTTTTPAATTATTKPPAATTAPAPTTPAPTTTKPTTPAATTTSPAPSGVKLGGTLKMAEVMMPRAGIGWIADPSGFAPGPFGFIFFDTLLWADNKGAIKPNLVTKWEVAPDLKSITLTLGQGIKFHDGSELNATVLKWNLDQLINNKIADYIFATSVDIVDSYTVRVNLKSYSNAILTTMGSTPIMSKAAYDAKGGGKAAEDWLRDNPVGTGPFKFVSYKPNVLIQGAKFNDYWQKGKPYLDGIDYYYIPDVMTKSATLQSGEMDVIAADLTKAEYDLLQKGFQVTKDYISIACFVPDSKNPNSPFANVKVRQALDYAIDRDAIVKSLGYGFWAPTQQYAVPGTSSYISNLPGRNYDPEKAKQLLTEAGYPKGFKTSIMGSVATTNKDVMVAVQGFLAKVGITADINMIDHGTYTSMILKGWDGLAAASKLIDANMNYAINNNWTQTSPYHPSLDKPNAFQALCDASAASKDYNPALVQKVVQYMFDNAMTTNLYAVTRGQLYNPATVHDLGFYTHTRAMVWTPFNTWLSR